MQNFIGEDGSIIKLFREWQLSGDDGFLKELYPKVKSALSYSWIKGGWDVDQDGVMEGVQHNTMDVEYYGPNPQMTIWYQGALRAKEEMAGYKKDAEMASKCKKLFLNGSKWTDENLFNGEYYIHKIVVPEKEYIPREQLVGMGSADYGNPDYQLGLTCISNIRNRYDRRKRSPFDEAECGHHYGRAMASWSALLAPTGFHYSGVTRELKFSDIKGTCFWSNGYAYGTATISQTGGTRLLTLNVLNGGIDISTVTIEGFGSSSFKKTRSIQTGGKESFTIK